MVKMDNIADSREERGKRKVCGEDAENGNDCRSVFSRRDAAKELLDCVVHSEEEAYKLYCDYGHRTGFSVRKGKQSYFIGTKNIRTKDYYCSKEGLKYDEPVTEANFNRPETRTNCKAMIRFRVDESGQWNVLRFVQDHNHELAKPGERHLLRSAKSLAIGKTGAIISDILGEPQPGIPCTSIAEESEMFECAEYTKRDCYNHVGVQSIMLIEPGDSQSLVSYFKRRTNEEGMFFWDVQVDQEGRVTNFFWRDGRSRNDFECFGDVVLFDNTYRNNRYNLACAPFFGINHHGQNVVFGCAFMLDESATSYTWLFKSFLESMGGQAPKSILTDQDEAISEALEKVYPNTHHCFSFSHIHKNAQAHLGPLNTSQTFQNVFSKCLHGCDSEPEFEECWATMLHEYKLQDNSWLADLYRLRHKWCSALNMDVFDGGMNSSQWGEGFNGLLSGVSDEATSLTKFAHSFEKLVKGLRRSESEEDFRSSQTAPVRIIKHSSVLKHAAEYYTHKMYKLFEAEFLDGCGATSCQETPCGGTIFRFELTMQGRGPKVWIVLLDTSTMELSCSCRKLETMGMLCAHALKAFSLKNVETVPERYILKRWTKDARKRQYKFFQDDLTQQECSEAELAYRNRAMQYAYNLVMKSQELEESRKVLWDTLEMGEKALEVFFEMRSSSSQSSQKDKEFNKKEKRKNMFGGEPSSKKTFVPPDSVEYLSTSNGYQPYSAPEILNGAPIGRPFYCQTFPTASMTTNQLLMHPSLHSLPLCASQDFAAYSSLRPSTSNFAGAKNV